MRMKLGARLPAAPLHPPRPRPRLRPPPRPSHRPPARLSAKLARLPASPRSVLPEADASRCRLRLLATSLPPELLRLPLTPASGPEEASALPGLLPRFPVATNGPPQPGSRARPLAVEDRAGAPAGGRQGRQGRAGERREVSAVGPAAPAPRPSSPAPCLLPPARGCAIWTCHVGATAAAAAPRYSPGEWKTGHALLPPFTHFHLPDFRAEILK